MKRFIYLIFLVLVGCSSIPRGVSKAKILIKTQPTAAKIYVNNEYVGISPLTTTIWYEKSKFINIKAEPFYESQFPQNIYLKVPPIPPQMTIFMDYQAKERVEIEEKSAIQEEYLAEIESSEQVEAAEEVVEIIKVVTEKQLIKLPQIYFAFDSADLAESEKSKMTDLVKFLSENPAYILIVHAHADERGSAEYNRQLSYRRGLAVKKFLAQQVDNEIKIIIHGERISLSEENQKLDYQLNRVVSFSLEQAEEEAE
ncbi:MAG: OmpA family protein [Candidatus Cloacimonadales bacterium]